MKVANVMSRQVDYISSDDTVEYASRIIFGRGINGLPICKNKTVIGFLTEQDILSKVYPTFQEFLEDPIHNKDFEKMEQEMSEVFKMKVDQIMSKNVITVKATTPLLKAQSIMRIHNVGRLPVIDDDKKLIGIISNSDVFKAIVREKLAFSVDEEYNDWLSKHYYQTVDIKNRLSYELPDLISLFKKHKVKTILDIGCGTADHILALAKEGYHVTGIDRSALMIKEAKKRMNGFPAHVVKRITLIKGEYNDLPKPLDKSSFDCVMILGNSLSHNPYIYQKTLEISANLLTGPSMLLIQNTNFEKVLKTNNRLLDLIFIPGDSYKSSGQEHAFLEFYDSPDEEEMTILKTFAVFDKSQSTWSANGVKNSIFAYVTRIGLERHLQGLGFKTINFYGSMYDGRHWDYIFRKPFSPLESDWMNVVAIKD